jgi:hypothetical protein
VKGSATVRQGCNFGFHVGTICTEPSNYSRGAAIACHIESRAYVYANFANKELNHCLQRYDA